MKNTPLEEVTAKLKTYGVEFKNIKKGDYMKYRVETITDFAENKAFYIKEDIIRDLRLYLNNPNKDVHDFIKNAKEKMLILEFLEDYTMEDRVWDWCDEYYGEEDEDIE